MSNLNKQAVYELFFNMGKKAALSKLALPTDPKNVQPAVTTPAPVAQPSTSTTQQTHELTWAALEKALAKLQAEELEAETELDNIRKGQSKPPFNRAEALKNLEGAVEGVSPSYVDINKLEADPIPQKAIQAALDSGKYTYYDHSLSKDPYFGTGEIPPDLVFTEKDLAALNSQDPEASPVDTPPVVLQTPIATNNTTPAPVAAKPRKKVIKMLLPEFVQQEVTTPAPVAPAKQQPTVATKSNFKTTQQAPPVASAPRKATPTPVRAAARRQVPVAKPTFDRKGFGTMMSDFGYGNTSPNQVPQNLANLMPKRTTPINSVVGPAKPLNQILSNKPTATNPIPQNLANLMPKRTTPINSVVGPAKPLNQILSNKPIATTSPAPKPVMDTTATTQAQPQVKQSFLSQFGIY